MYYDLVASLPQMPHFSRAVRLPITKLRLLQRLKRLTPSHAAQLQRASKLVAWRPGRLLNTTDAELVRASAAAMQSELAPPLREYVEFRMNQQTLVAAARRKRAGLDRPEPGSHWGVGERIHLIRKNWNVPNFGLAHIHPWLPKVNDMLNADDALGMERVLVDVTWNRLSRYAEGNSFSFEAVFAYVFKWDLLQAWLACDADRGRIRFTELIDQVTHVENN
jgi:hypothetical protein